MLALYCKPDCPPCKATKRELDKLVEKIGLEYQQFDVTAYPSAADVVKALGYSSAPVVVVNADWHWTGFRPTQLALLGE